MDGGTRRDAAVMRCVPLGLADDCRRMTPVEKPQAGPLPISRGDPPFLFQQRKGYVMAWQVRFDRVTIDVAEDAPDATEAIRLARLKYSADALEVSAEKVTRETLPKSDPIVVPEPPPEPVPPRRKKR